MNDPEIIANNKWWFQTGSLSALGVGVGYVIIIVVYIQGGALPKGAEAWLNFLAGRAPAWWVILGLSVFTDILFLPTALALYLALRRHHRAAMLVGSSLLALFVALDLAVTWPNYAALIALSGSYAATAGEAQRAVLVAAASYATAVLSSPLFGVYTILVPSLGIFLISLVMLRSVLFSQKTAYAGLAAGLLGLIAVIGPALLSSLGLFAVFSSILTTVWFLLLSWQLYWIGSD